MKYRTKHIGVKKEVIYQQLKQYCKEEGKILSKKELHMNGKTGRITEIKIKNKKKNIYRRKEIRGLGEIVQVDSIHLR